MNISVARKCKAMFVAILLALSLVAVAAPAAYAYERATSMNQIGNETFEGEIFWNYQGKVSSAYSNLYHPRLYHTSKVWYSTGSQYHNASNSGGLWSYASLNNISFPSYTTFYFSAIWW